jgi:hypothetical protein
MSSFRSEPFLWIHLSGIAIFPLCLELVWLGLAIGDSLPFSWLELLLVASVGIIPVLWMQLSRPFDIFSILFLSIEPAQLSTEQRQILTLFQTKKHKLLSLLAALLMVFIVWELNRLAPLAASAIDFLPQWRILGLLIAMVGVLASSLFLEVPISVLGVLTNSQAKFSATEPLPLEKITQNFTIPGWQVKKILPKIISELTKK